MKVKRINPPYRRGNPSQVIFRSLPVSEILGWSRNSRFCILGDPGATSRDEAIFSGESLLQELKSPWELIPTEPVPEVVQFRPADWPEKYFSGQSARRSSRATLSPSYKKWFSSSIDLLGPSNGKILVESFRKKKIQ